MPFEPLVDAWEKSRKERAYMRPGERSLSIERAIKGRMPTHRILDGLIPRRREPEPDDRERE